RSLERFIHTVGSTFKMPALTVYDRAVGISKFHSMVVVDFAIFLTVSPCPTTCTLDRYRITSFYPVGHINVVHVLFYNMVSTEPIEIIPIAHLVFHFSLFRLTRTYP